MGFHNVGHVGPPALYDGIGAQVLGGAGTGLLLNGEERMGSFIQENGVIVDTAMFQQLLQLRPDCIMAFAVFLGKAGFKLHFEGCFHKRME